MAQETNQSGAQASVTESFDKHQVNNLTFLMDTLNKLGFGENFNKALAEGMRKGADQIEPTLDFTFKDRQETVRVTPSIQRMDGEYGDFYVMKGYRATMVDKPQTPEEKLGNSQFMHVFKQNGFTLPQTRNLLDGRAVRNKNEYEGEKYFRHTRINFEGTKTASGNYPFESVRENKENFDLAALLSKVPLGNLSQDRKEQLMRNLNDGEMVPFLKRSPDGNEQMKLYAAPHKGALVTIDSDGVEKEYTVKQKSSNQVQVTDPTQVKTTAQSQQTEGQTTAKTPTNDQTQKAAEVTAKIIEANETQSQGRGRGQGKSAA